MRIRAVVVLLGVAAVVAAQSQEVVIKGRVVDAAGKPVAGADVSTLWLEGQPSGGVQTDSDGRFELPAKAYNNRPVAIMVQDKGRKRGIISRFSSASFGKERKLELEKLVKVSGSFVSRELGEKVSWSNVYVNVIPGRIRVARYMSDEAKFEFLLPSGEFQFYMYGTDVKKKTVERFIESDEGDVKFGKVDLPATEIAKLYGKKAPALHVTAARGVKQNVRWKDFRGKYVILEFWGFW